MSSFSDWYYHFGALPALAVSPRPVRKFLAKYLVNRRLAEQKEISEEMRRSVKRIFGTLDDSSVDRIIRGVFETRIREDACVFEFPFWTPANVDKNFAFKGLEHLIQARETGTGAILLDAHIGAICSGLVALGLKGLQLYYLANNTPDDPSFPKAAQKHAQMKIRGMEKTGGGEFILFDIGESLSSSIASRKILRKLKANEFVVILLDVSPHVTSTTEEVKFMGLDAVFPAGFLRLAETLKCPIIPTFTLRNQGKGPAHTVYIKEPIYTSGNNEKDLQKCVSGYDEVIRENPAQWLPWEWLSHFLK